MIMSNITLNIYNRYDIRAILLKHKQFANKMLPCNKNSLLKFKLHLSWWKHYIIL